MAVKGATLLNWNDLKNMMDPDGTVAVIAEVLTQTNELLADILWRASNMPLAHKTTQRTGLPTIFRRRLNRGTQSSKSSTGKVEEALTMTHGWGTVDIKELEVYGNELDARRAEARAFAESFAQQAAIDYTNGNLNNDPEVFNGFLTRYATLDNQVLSAGGTGNDLASVLLVGWGLDKVYGLFPKNTQAGLQHTDWGRQIHSPETDPGGSSLGVFKDEFSWDYGLCVHDPRYVVRIANIEPADVLGVTASSTQALDAYDTNIVMLMARSLHHLHNRNNAQPRFYLPRFLIEGLDVQYLARTTDNAFDTMQVDGQEVMAYRGVPLRMMDAMTDTEGAIS